MKLKAAELAGEQVDNKTRLEVIKKEEGIIAAESKARKEEEAAELEEKARVSLFCPALCTGSGFGEAVCFC